MTRDKNRLFLLFIWGFPLLAGFLLSFPSLFLGPDTETINLYLYHFTFGTRTPDLLYPFTHLISYGVGFEPYRPLTYSEYALDFLLFGNEVFWYRLENLVIFLFVVWGLMRIAKKLYMGKWGIFVCGMFLVLHPAHQVMLLSIFPRTDFGVALFTVAVVNLVLRNRPHSKIDMHLILAYCVFFLGTYWKENMLSIAILILFIDLVAGWTKGRWFTRVLLHLPFYVIGALGMYIQYYMTNSLGYSMGGGDMWDLMINLPARTLPYFEPLWGISALFTQNLFSGTFFSNAAVFGLIITIIVLLIGPNGKSRLSLAAMLILLAPYLLTWSSYMHIFTASLGLAIWAGFFVDGFGALRNKLFRFAPFLIFVPLLVNWGYVYNSDYLKVFEYYSNNQRMIQYITHKYPDPPSDVTFIVKGWVDQNEGKAISKKARISEMNLRIIYHRLDVNLKILNFDDPTELNEGKGTIYINLPKAVSFSRK